MIFLLILASRYYGRPA